MKKIKKLSVVIVALAVCMLFGSVVWAETGGTTPTLTATFENATIETSDDAQTVTLTVGWTSAVEITGLQAFFNLPEDWEVTAVENTTLVFTEDNWNTIKNSENPNILWLDLNAANQSTATVAVLTIKVPANIAVGTYEVGLADIETMVGSGTEPNMSFSPAPYGGDVTATLTVTEKQPEVTNISVVAKGTISYTVSGQVVTVTHTAACKVGYWDATNSKYVAISAVATGDGSYSFTAPDGVTEVLLVVKGDVTGEGTINSADTMNITRSLLPTTHAASQALTAVAIFAADVTGEGTINSADTMNITRSLLPATHAAYSVLAW